jgi:predicted RNA polymerase sigma factor
MAQLDMAKRSGDTSAVRSIYENNKKQLTIVGRMKAIDNARNRMQRQIKEIERNPRIPEETKKKIIRIRRQKINELQQRGLILMRSVGYKKAG